MTLAQTPTEIAVEIQLSRSQHKGAFLVLEGDADANVFKRFIKEDFCKIIPAVGKSNACLALKILDNESFPGVLAVVDADFDRLEDMTLKSENLLMTDTHDLETLILKSSDYLERLLDEFGDQTIMDVRKVSLLEALIECARPVGYLRWVFQKNGEICFKKLNFKSFVEGYPLKPHLEKMFEAIMGQCVKAEARDRIDVEVLKLELKNLMNENHDKWQICNGHDMIKILAVGLRNYFGKRKAKKLYWETIESSLRMAYEYKHFQRTNLYSDILKWQEKNQPYSVMKP